MAGGLWQFTFAFREQEKPLVDICTFFLFLHYSHVEFFSETNVCKEFAEICLLKQKLKINKFLFFFMEAFTSHSCIIFSFTNIPLSMVIAVLLIYIYTYIFWFC